MNKPVEYIDLSAVRRLGASIEFTPREWLPSMFRRVGHAMESSAADIVAWCGLNAVPSAPRQKIGNVLTEEVARAIHIGLGVDADTLSTMVMSHLPEELEAFRVNGTFAQSKNWTRGGGTRYCPTCLLERPGVFYTEWRLWWCFICERHNTVLHESCPACHQPIVEASLREVECRDPALCWASLGESDHCRHPLAQTWDEAPLTGDSPMLLAQRAISRHWRAGTYDSPDIPAATLRGVAIALLSAGHHDTISKLSGVDESELRGLFDHSVRIGTSPPKEPLAMAALLGAAYRLIMDDETMVTPTIRQLTYDRSARTDKEAPAPWSARNFLDAWPGIDSLMRGRVIRSLDHDLRPIQRLVHGSAASAAAWEGFELIRRAGWDAPDAHPESFSALMNAADSPTSVTWAECAIPPLLWPSWAAPLGINPRTDGITLQHALADALRIAGTGALPDYEAIAGIGRKLRPTMFGTRQQTTSILRQLTELALSLRAAPGPINYRQRQQLDTSRLLDEHHWRLICQSVGHDTGRARRHLNAQRYAYMRITATPPSALPDRLRFREHAPDAASYTEFLMQMTAELKEAIDTYLSAWLTLTPPPNPSIPPSSPVVTWSPRRFAHPDANLGHELGDIDLELLHDRLRMNAPSPKDLAAELSRPVRHVRWAVAAFPPPTGNRCAPIDWLEHLPAEQSSPRLP